MCQTSVLLVKNQTDDQVGLLKLTKIEPDELHHVRLQQVHVPPGNAFGPSQSASVNIEEGTRASIDGLLWNATQV